MPQIVNNLPPNRLTVFYVGLIYVMKHLFRLFVLVLLIPAFPSQGQPPIEQQGICIIPANDALIQYMGRVDKTKNGTGLYWSGTSATIRFRGWGCGVTMADETGNNYYYLIIDNKVDRVIHPGQAKQIYYNEHLLKYGVHTASIFRLTEESAGKTTLMDWQFSGTSMKPAPLPARSIQFYGNSITAGYSVDDTTGDSRAPEYFNNYYTYAAITARHYNAAYTNISKSGIGIMLSWFPVVMPELYDRIVPTDSNSHFDYSHDNTNIVVIDLFQNDSWLVNKPDHAQFKARFGATAPTPAQIVAAYKRFVQTIRKCHPKAHIICTLGSMDATKEGSPWPGYIKEAVSQLNDKKVYTCFFPYKGTPGHPKRKEQKAMADTLIRFIDKNIKW